MPSDRTRMHRPTKIIGLFIDRINEGHGRNPRPLFVASNLSCALSQCSMSACCQSVLFPYFGNVAALYLLAEGVRSIYVPFINYREFDELYVSCR